MNNTLQINFVSCNEKYQNKIASDISNERTLLGILRNEIGILYKDIISIAPLSGHNLGDVIKPNSEIYIPYIGNLSIFEKTTI